MTLLSENEARGQICPFIRFCTNENDATQYDKAPIYVHQTCQASECKMAWRWDESAVFEALDERKGYCGIAGHPGTPS